MVLLQILSDHTNELISVTQRNLRVRICRICGYLSHCLDYAFFTNITTVCTATSQLQHLAKISLGVAAFTEEMSSKCGNIVPNYASSYRKHLQLVMVK